MSGDRAKRIITLLKRKYGKHRWKWNPNPVDVLVGTILSQNTSDVNSHRAFSELKSKFKNWEEVSNAGENEIRKAIAAGGLANTKSRRIKIVLKEIRKRVGKIDLKFLADLPLEEGKGFLDSLSGVGPKTTAVVLMFSFNKPLMPLDTHCMRVSKRLGLIPMKAGAEKAHELMNEIVPNEEKRNLHINLILHGRKICRAQVPICSTCILQKICPRRGVKNVSNLNYSSTYNLGGLMELVTALVELYKRAETQLPEDVVNALKESLKKEDNPLAVGILKMLIKNAEMANESRRPICQDTGMPTFYVKYNGKLIHQNEIEKAISEATKRAIKEVPLRVRFVEPFSGEGEEYNIYGTPIIYFEEWNKNYLHFDLLCQGAGSENVSKHYSLPDDELKAARDLDGVRNCIIDTVKEAQGKGCPPGIIGVAVGSDRESCARHSKLQLLRRLDDRNPNKKLDEFEKKMKKELNWLGIGPMGLGGRTTVLGVKIIFLQRYTASFFVDVNYNCWRLCIGKMNFKKGVATYE